MRKVAIFPEIIESSFKKGLQDELCLWIIIGSLLGDTGTYKKTEIFQTIKFNKRTLYRYLNAGNKLFWELSENYVSLYSLGRICAKLNIPYVRKYGIYITAYDFEGKTLREKRGVLLCSLLSVRSSPQTYQNIADRCNLSKRTVIDLINSYPNLIKKRNYAYICTGSTLHEAIKTKEELNCEHLCIVKENNNFHILRQLANSYKIKFPRTDKLTRYNVNKTIRKIIKVRQKPAEKRKLIYIKSVAGKKRALQDFNISYKGKVRLETKLTEWHCPNDNNIYFIWQINDVNSSEK
jgi:hypothetical protein